MRYWVLAIGFLLLDPVSGSAAVLGTGTLTSGWSIHEGQHRVRPKLSYVDSYRGLFDDVWVDSTSLGTVLVATADSDADFAFIAGRLSDGSPEDLCVGTCEAIECAAECTSEQRFFSLAVTDFLGATVNKVSLRVNSLSFGLDPQGGQIVLFSFTVTVEGAKGSVAVRPASWGRLKSLYR